MMGLPAHKLSARIQVAALLLIAGFAGLLLLVVGQDQRAALRQETLDTLERESTVGARRLDEAIAHLRSALLFLGDTAAIRDYQAVLAQAGRAPAAARTGAEARLATTIAAFARANPEYPHIHLVELSSPPRELPRLAGQGGERPLPPALLAHLVAGVGTAGAPRVPLLLVPRTPDAATPTLVGAQALTGPDGRPQLLVVVEGALAPLVDAILLPEDGRATSYLLDARGNTLLRRGPPRLDATMLRTLIAPMQAVARPDGMPARTTAQGFVTARRIVLDADAPGEDLLLVEHAPSSPFSSLFDSTYPKLVIAVVLLTLLVGGAGILVIRAQLRPLARLSRAARRLAAGDHAATLPEAGGTTEVATLTRAFREMRDAIAQRELVLRELNRELEARVVARGAELELAGSVVQNTGEGVLITDVTGTIVSVNPAFSEITGYTADEAIGKRPSLLKSDHHDDAFYHRLWKTLLSTGQWRGELWNRRKDGEAYLQQLTINRIPGPRGAPAHYVGVFSDITAARRKDEHIRHLAFHDALTGLPNRSLLQDRLQHAIARARRSAEPLALLFIDLDRFKSVNDSLGHDVGDRLLQAIAARLTGRLRSSDTVARMGGDEFVALLEGPPALDAVATAAGALIAAVSEPLQLDGHRILVGASIGIACFPEDGSDAFTLMKHADTAMYAAKEAGRGQYRFFQHSMREAAERRLELEVELRDAIGSAQIELHYQPKFKLDSERPYGVEALVRWRHPRLGLLHPDEFIPLAEESSLIVALGNQVLETACRQAAAWHARGLALSMAVNVSARQFAADDLAAHIAALLDRHALPPGALQLEITESTLMANPDEAAETLHALRDLGVAVAVDDFGTGYSSLTYLRRLPMDALKIDRSFVMAADHSEDDAQLVRTIVDLAHSLHLEVVAEGVENAAQVELLRTAGCTRLQGYHFCHPLAANELEAWLDRPDPSGQPLAA